MAARVIVVGLGPAGEEFVTAKAAALLQKHDHVYFRTTAHPAAGAFGAVSSFDQLYEEADDFESLYRRIVDELSEAAQRHGEIVYAVPGSPMVAEHSVELLMARQDLEVVLIPAMSFLDLCWAALGRDPFRDQIQLLDALQIGDALDFGGPLLISQTHSRAVLSELKLSVDTDLVGTVAVTILHHLGLPDQQVVHTTWNEMDRFDADHLTSVFVEHLRTVEDASRDLVAMMRRLRAECPWDIKQTHASLARHLLEEAYEGLEAIEELARCLESGDDEHLDAAYAHAQEELGDVVFQVVFHAHLASEEGRFDLAGVFDAVREKLVGRHPHVFGDVEIETADDVASRWEAIKQAEKGRESVTEGIPIALPSLARFAKLRRKATAISMSSPDVDSVLAGFESSLNTLRSLPLALHRDGPDRSEVALTQVGDLLVSAAELACALGFDPEEIMRSRSNVFTSVIRKFEQNQ